MTREEREVYVQNKLLEQGIPMGVALRMTKLVRLSDAYVEQLDAFGAPDHLAFVTIHHLFKLIEKPTDA